jgi:hypothetical protein
LRQILIERGQSLKSFAEEINERADVLGYVLASRVPGHRIRRKIEVRLDRPIWNTRAHFEFCNVLTERAGFDPGLLSAKALRKTLLSTPDYNFPDSGPQSRAKLI